MKCLDLGVGTRIRGHSPSQLVDLSRQVAFFHFPRDALQFAGIDFGLQRQVRHQTIESRFLCMVSQALAQSGQRLHAMGVPLLIEPAEQWAVGRWQIHHQVLHGLSQGRPLVHVGEHDLQCPILSACDLTPHARSSGRSSARV